MAKLDVTAITIVVQIYNASLISNNYLYKAQALYISDYYKLKLARLGANEVPLFAPEILAHRTISVFK